MALKPRVDRLERDKERAELEAVDAAIGQLTPAEREAWARALELDLDGKPIPPEVGELADQAARRFVAYSEGG
jgi:hypothetical protein